MELQSYLQEAIGYSLTGDVSEQCFFLLYGPGANGKTTLLELLFYVWSDYTQAADFETFMHNGNKAPRNDIARMRGARLVKSVEADAGRRLSEAIIKQAMGNETISARFLFQEAFDFRPQFKLWLATNHRPKIVGDDDSIWHRVRVIPFDYKIPTEERDKYYVDRLKSEASGFLNWALAGLTRWRERGLRETAAVLRATDEYRASQDVTRRFRSERCIVDSEERCSPRQLRDSFKDWLRENGLWEYQGCLKKRLEDLGCRQLKMNGARKRWGLGLVSRRFEYGEM